MDSLTPITGEEEEIDDQDLDDQEIDDDAIAAGAPEGDQAEGEPEEMPDDLLSPEELATRTAERAGRKPAATAREPEGGGNLREELLGIFADLRQQQPPPQRGDERPKPAELQPFVLSEADAKRLSDKALTEEGGIAKLVAASVNIGERRALQRMAQSPEGQASMESSGRLFAQDYLADKLDDPSTKFGKATKPQFQAILKTYNMAELSSMSKADRDAWFDEVWERATGRALMNKAVTKTAPSPGVARGGGGKPGVPGRGRVVFKMSAQELKDLRASAPRLFSGEEGEKRFRRQVWEIEHGVTSSGAVRSMTRDSLQFSQAVGSGG